MKKFLVLIFMFFALPVFAGEYDIDAYYKHYEALQPADFEYMFGIDSHQAEDYLKYNGSPYPLLRTAVNFVFKGTVIPPGYYLLTPREKNGKDYVLFKQEGRVKYVIPVYDKKAVNIEFYDKYIPQPKKTWWDKVVDFGNKFVSTTSKQSKRTAIPKAYIDVNQIGQDFWEVIVYYGLSKYYLLFEQK